MPSNDTPSAATARAAGDAAALRAGAGAALGAYGLWGTFPLMFRLLQGASAPLIVAHRIVWAVPFVLLILWVYGRLGEVAGALRNRRAVAGIAMSATLLGVNWLIFVWSVEANRVLETSFGYFINPLVSVAIGMVFLGERHGRRQTIAILIAVAAVALQAVAIGGLPWVSLALAFSFGFYGFARKTVPVASTPGFFIETLMMLPFALGYIVYVLWRQGPGMMAVPQDLSYFVLTGPATAIALIMFAFATKRLRLASMGMFQYITPSMHFLIAVLLFHEPLTPLRLVSFVLIWISLAVFTSGLWRRRGASEMEAT